MDDCFPFFEQTKIQLCPCDYTYLQEKIKKLFNRIDKNRSGVVSYSELFQIVYKDEAAAQVKVSMTLWFSATTTVGSFSYIFKEKKLSSRREWCVHGVIAWERANWWQCIFPGELLVVGVELEYPCQGKSQRLKFKRM